MKRPHPQQGQQLPSHHVRASQAGVEGPDPLLVTPTKHLLPAWLQRGCTNLPRRMVTCKHTSLEMLEQTRTRSREEGAAGKDTSSTGFQKGCPSPRMGSCQPDREQIQAENNTALVTGQSRSSPQLILRTLGCTLGSPLPSMLQGEAAEWDRSGHLVP